MSKRVPLSKAIYESRFGDFVFLSSVLVRYKVIVNENVSFINHASGIRRFGCKLTMYRKKDIDVTIFRHVFIIGFCSMLQYFSYQG